MVSRSMRRCSDVQTDTRTRLRIYESPLRNVKYVYDKPVKFTGDADHRRHEQARIKYIESHPRTEFNVG